MTLADRFKTAWDVMTKSPQDLKNSLIPLMSSYVGGQFGQWQPKDVNAQVKANLSWVYVCTTIISNRFASLKWKLYKNRNGKREEILQHPFIDITKNVNPQMNNFELKDFIGQSLECTGNAYIYLFRNRLGVPQEIWPILPQYIRIVADKQKFIKGYLYRSNGQDTPFLPEEIVHFKLTNLKDYYYGMSPIEAAAWAIDLNEFAKEHSLGLFQNQAVPGGILLFKNKMYDKDEDERIRIAWEKAYRGVDNAGKTARIYGDMEYKQLSISPRDLDFILGQKLTREEICAIFKVPMALILTESVNRSNMDASEFTIAKNVISPRAKLVEEKINEKLLPMYDDGLECEIENPIPKYFEDIIKQEEVDTANGIRSINEIRAERGLDAVEGGDEHRVPFNLQPISSSGQQEILQEQVPGKAIIKSKEQMREIVYKDLKRRTDPMTRIFKKVIDKFFNSQRKEVLDNLQNVKAVQKVSRDDIARIIFDEKKAKRNLAAIGKPYIKNSALSGARATQQLYGFDISWDTVINNIDNWVGGRAEQFSEWANETTLSNLRSILSQGIDEGESIPQLAKRIETFFDGEITSRSEMIARTETLAASNEGNLEIYKEAGVEKKEFFTTPDDRLCEFCMDLDEDKVGVDESFHSDEFGDFDTPPIHPNCRCSLLPVLKEE